MEVNGLWVIVSALSVGLLVGIYLVFFGGAELLSPLEWILEKIGLSRASGKPVKGGTGLEGLLESMATVQSGFEAPDEEGDWSGKVFVAGEYWKAKLVDGSGPLSQGCRVRIKEVTGLTLFVRYDH